MTNRFFGVWPSTPTFFGATALKTIGQLTKKLWGDGDAPKRRSKR